MGCDNETPPFHVSFGRRGRGKRVAARGFDWVEYRFLFRALAFEWGDPESGLEYRLRPHRTGQPGPGFLLPRVS